MAKRNRQPVASDPAALTDGQYTFNEYEQADHDELAEKRQQAMDSLAVLSLRYAEARAQMDNAAMALSQAHQAVEVWWRKVSKKRGLDKHPLKEFNGDEGYALFEVPPKSEG